MDFANCGANCGVSSGGDFDAQPPEIEKKMHSKDPIKVETAFIVPGAGHNFWDVLWKHTWMGFCHTDDRDDAVSGATCSKVSDADLTTSSRHRRNQNVLFNLIPQNIETGFYTNDDITSPLSSPTELFSTPLGDNPTYQTPSKPEKSHRKTSLPKVQRDEFCLPSFRSDRNAARILFDESQSPGDDDVKRIESRRGSKRGRDDKESSCSSSFCGWCVIWNEAFSYSNNTENIQFITVDVMRGSILFRLNKNDCAFQEILVDDSFNISSIEINKKAGYGVCLKWGDENNVMYIAPIDRPPNSIKPSNTVLEYFSQIPRESTSEWGTIRFLDENFATCTSHERFLHLYFLLDAIRFKRSVYFRPG